MRIAATAALVAMLALAAGCGDDDEETTAASAGTTTAPETTTSPAETPESGTPEQPEEQGGVAAESAGGDPKAALEAFFVSGDPDLVCGELSTERLLSTAYGDEKGCRQAQVPAATPDAIEIMNLEASGDEARAIVVPDGGPNDGIETEVVLLNEDGVWLVDSLEADVPAGP